MSGSVCWWLSQGVADPSPLSFLDLLLNGDLLCSFPEVLVGDHLWPSDVQNVAETSVDERLQLVGVCFCGAPCLGAIEED